MYIAHYYLVGYDATGNRIGQIEGLDKLDITLSLNKKGAITFDCTDNRFQYEDYQIEVWRSINNFDPVRLFDTRFLIRKFSEKTSNRGRISYTYIAYGPLDLLERRIVSAFAESSGATKTGAVDNLMKAYVNEAFTDTAWNTARDAVGYFGVASNTSSAASLTVSYAWQPIIKVLDDLTNRLYETNGSRIFYDIENLAGVFTFKTYMNYRGADLRFGVAPIPMVFSRQRGNLDNIVISTDYTTQKTAAIVAGKGDKSLRMVRGVVNPTLQVKNPASSTEIFVNATNLDTTTQLDELGKNVLGKSKVFKFFTGDIINSQNSYFGLHWNYGDYVTAYHNNFLYSCLIRDVKVSYQAGKEKVNGKLYIQNQ